MSVRFTKAIVVGASSGIGEAIARQLAAEGTQVALVARRAAELNRLEHEQPKLFKGFVHDVRQPDTTPELFERIVREMGGLDLLVYAAGVLARVAEGEYAFDKDRETIEVNLVGAMAWMNLAAARFEAARAGTILGISSIAGERGRRGQPAYGTSKAALSAYLEALRNRCSRYGVNVATAKPGFVDTPMTRGLKGLIWLIPADEAARQCLAIARKGTSATGFVPKRWGLVAVVLRTLPSLVFRRLNF
jgi:NAD(P)-dependent dehydrogenase (short-subunit alcohol dehydrogenase family)